MVSELERCTRGSVVQHLVPGCFASASMQLGFPFMQEQVGPLAGDTGHIAAFGRAVLALFTNTVDKHSTQ